MIQRLRNIRNDSVVSGISGAPIYGLPVYGLNDQQLGTMEDVVYDVETGMPSYAVVNSGGWLKSDWFLVPVDRLARYEERDDAFYLPVTRESVAKLPAFDGAMLDSDDSFRAYESRYRPYWESVPATLQRHPRIIAVDRQMRPKTVAVSDVNPEAITVYGVFNDQDHVHKAVDALQSEGFTSDEISVVFPEHEKTKRFAVEHNTKAPEGAAAGGATGVVAGGIVGWLAGIGTLAIPGIGPLLAAGPIFAALAGAGAGGAIGGLAGALIGLGLPELEAKRYESEIRQGRILVSVFCSDQRFAYNVRKTLERSNARDLYITGETKAA